jgi:beta-lactam-binding protein with PASTA domain
MPLVSFLVGYLTLYYLYRPMHIRMPNLIGLALHDALAVVTSVGCVLSDYGEIVSEQYPIPTIVAQDPSPFNEVKVGQTVFVSIGKPPLSKQAPSFIGKTEFEIQKLAEQNSLYIHVKPVYYRGLNGICCGQFPQAGLLLSDQYIIVYVAKDIENRFVMPLLLGRRYEDVEFFLMEHSMVLHCSKVTGDKSMYTVIKQIPSFGDLIHIKNGFVVDVQFELMNKGLCV